MKVLIADDHPMIRDGLARTLRRLMSEVEVVEAATFDAVDVHCAAHVFDLAVIDLNMPGMDGLVGLRRLRHGLPALPVVVTSGQDDVETIRNVLATGVKGFITKSDGPDDTLEALRKAIAGEPVLPRHALGLVATAMRGRSEGLPLLTPRQLDVLYELIEGGLSNREIGGRLGIGEGTVRTHIDAIRRALGAHNRTEAAIRARELGFRRPARRG